MSASHTPGPWRADRRAILAGEGMQTRCIAEVWSGAAASLQEADANERLIAAAPELLAALERLVANIERWLETGAVATAAESHAMYDQMVAVIAKAKGGAA